MKKFSIVFQSDTPLPVKKYGGIERSIFWHMCELVRQGHRVHLIGHPAGTVSEYGINHIPYLKDPQGKDQAWEKLIPPGVDIIHLSTNYAPRPDIPYLNAIQGNGRPGETFTKNAVFVSKKHASNHGSDAYVLTGLPLDEYPLIDSSHAPKWDNFLFLAKASWSVKNVASAIKVCKKSKKHLHIAGGRYFWPSRYIHGHGMVGGQEKLEIMKRCHALIFPVRWHEPFGIAIIEAMAMGLPVLGSPYGSLPELINADSGKVCQNEAELLAMVLADKNPFNPETVRAHVAHHFSIEKHTQDFLKVYQRLSNGESLNTTAPTWKLPESANTLLAF